MVTDDFMKTYKDLNAEDVFNKWREDEYNHVLEDTKLYEECGETLEVFVSSDMEDIAFEDFLLGIRYVENGGKL